jgi:hypothetical protein
MNDLIVKIINYVIHTPENTNYLVLLPMLEELVGASLDEVKLYIEDGNLYAKYPDNSKINFSLDSSGNLIYTVED